MCLFSKALFRLTFLSLLFGLFTVAVGPASAHELRPAYLALKQVSTEEYHVRWKVPSKGDGIRLRLNPIFPEDSRVLGAKQSRFVRASHIESFRLIRLGGLEGGSISIDGLQSTLTDVLVRLQRLDGSTQVLRLTPEKNSFVVESTPSSLSVMQTYLVLGVEHILLGIDHLLFVLALLILVKGWKRLLGTVTAFTVSHSITLAASTLHILSVSIPPVEATIALSILFLATEIMKAQRGEKTITSERPWLVAFIFGLLHGFGFASVLSEIGLPQADITLALLMFNVGVEVGQIMFIALAVTFIAVARRIFRKWPLWLQHVPAYGIGSMAAFWLIERVSGF